MSISQHLLFVQNKFCKLQTGYTSSKTLYDIIVYIVTAACFLVPFMFETIHFK